MFEFLVTQRFIKNLKNIDQENQKNIKEKLASLQKIKNPLLYAKKLRSHKDKFRFRSGHYRMVFRLEKNRIILEEVDHRKNIYKNI